MRTSSSSGTSGSAAKVRITFVTVELLIVRVDEIDAAGKFSVLQISINALRPSALLRRADDRHRLCAQKISAGLDVKVAM